MTGLLGKKLGMTSVFDDHGQVIPCTVIEAGPCYVTHIKTKERDGYEAIQIGFGEKKERLVNKPLRGHFAKAGVKLLGDHYWNDAFRHPGTWNQDVETRIDPWDIRVCYVWLNHRWERCVSKHFGQLGQVSLTELKAYTADARRNSKLHSKELSAHQVVEWVNAHDPNNFKDSLRIRQDAMRNLQSGLGMGAIEPEPPDLPATAFALPVSTLAPASIPPTTPISSEDDDDYDLF